jgi:hypothetical protein
MKKILFPILALFAAFPIFLTAQELHKWTNTQGATIEAAFVKLEGTTLTIDMGGKSFDLPLSGLRPESQELAQKLAAPGKPQAPSVTERVVNWKDPDGRIIKAKFIKLVGETLTIDMGGQPFALDLNNLDANSRKQAQNLHAQHMRQLVTAGIQDWQSTDGRVVQAKFVKLSGNNVTIEMNGQPFDLPLARFSQDSQDMARALHEFTKPSSVKTLEARMEKSMEKGLPDKIEVTLAMEKGLAYLTGLWAQDPEGWPSPPVRQRKLIGYKKEPRKYRVVMVEVPVYEWHDEIKEVFKDVKVGSEGITTRQKVKEKVKVRGKQIETRQEERHYRDDKNGTVELMTSIPQYEDGGPDFWRANNFGHNALAMYAMMEAGLDTGDPTLNQLFEYLTDIYTTFGLPDRTWDLAWSVCAFARSGIQENKDFAKLLAAKLAGGQLQNGEGKGLWGPLSMDPYLIKTMLAYNIEHNEDHAEAKLKFEESGNLSFSNKMDIALENVRRTNLLKDAYSMLLKAPDATYFGAIPLTDPGGVLKDIKIMGLPYYPFTQANADLESTLVALYALGVAMKYGALPDRTTTLELEVLRSRKTFGRSVPIMTVITNAAAAIAKRQLQTGDFDEMNLVQPVTEYTQDLIIRGVPANASTFPKLPSNTSLADTAKGIAGLEAAAFLGGAQVAPRIANNRNAAIDRLQPKLADTLYLGDADLSKNSIAGLFDIALAISSPAPVTPEKVEFLGTLSRFLVDNQASNGSWREKFPKPFYPSSVRQQLEALPEHVHHINRNVQIFDYSQAHTPRRAYFHPNYYIHKPGLLATAYSLLALNQALEHAPEPPPVVDNGTPMEEHAAQAVAAPANTAPEPAPTQAPASSSPPEP